MRVLQTEKMREGEQEGSKSKLVQEPIIQLIYAPYFFQYNFCSVLIIHNGEWSPALG